MNRLIVFCMVCMLSLLSVGCGEDGADEQIILKGPPVLTVICGDEQVSALQGTTWWSYQEDKEEQVSYHLDSDHMSVLIDKMTPLPLTNEQDLTAYLKWQVMPDQVRVFCWPVKDIPVTTGFAEGKGADETDHYTIQLQDGSYLYEVTASWSHSELYGGSAYYGFYVEK